MTLLNTPLIWVDTPDKLAIASHQLLREPSISVDTESNSLYVFRERVCLIQFSIPSADYLIDPFALEDLSPLAEIFETERIEKIFHAAEYDIICLKRDYGFAFHQLFDTMIAAKILGIREVGLNSLLQTEFNIAVNKRYQKADWGKRPLPPEYQQYARNDTHHLKALRNVLMARITEKGLDMLAREEFERVSRSVGTPAAPLEEQIWHLNGIRGLTPRQTAILFELLRWRENKARDLNRPAFKVMNNDDILKIAVHCPDSPAALMDLLHLSERTVQRYGAELLEAVETGQQRPPMYPPLNGKCDQALRNRIDRLKEFRKKAAKELQVESDIVLPRELLYQLAEDPPAGWKEFEARMSFYPWRMQHYGKAIFHAIHPRWDARPE